jgi:hypothetical protein
LRLKWKKVKIKHQKDPITYTKDDTKFKVGRITGTTLFNELLRGEKPIRRKNL